MVNVFAPATKGRHARGPSLRGRPAGADHGGICRFRVRVCEVTPRQDLRDDSGGPAEVMRSGPVFCESTRSRSLPRPDSAGPMVQHVLETWTSPDLRIRVATPR